MATRGTISIVDKRTNEGKGETIYTHWDSYPSNNGRILYQQMNLILLTNHTMELLLLICEIEEKKIVTLLISVVKSQETILDKSMITYLLWKRINGMFVITTKQDRNL